MIVVDSSVWIDFLRGTPTPQADKLDSLLGVVPLAIGDLILAEGFVKLIQDEIRICCEIISCVVDVAGIEADAQPVRKTDTVIDCSQFFKAFADFGAFACHCFQCDADRRRLGKHFV